MLVRTIRSATTETGSNIPSPGRTATARCLSATAQCTSIHCRTKSTPSRPPSACINPRMVGLQLRRVVLAGVFLPILAEAAVRGFMVWVGAEFVDINVDAEAGSRRQIDPAVLHRQWRGGDFPAKVLEIHEIF